MQPRAMKHGGELAISSIFTEEKLKVTARSAALPGLLLDGTLAEAKSQFRSRLGIKNQAQTFGPWLCLLITSFWLRLGGLNLDGILRRHRPSTIRYAVKLLRAI